MINDKQFCFIICTNNKQYLDECLIYISLLNIPEGYTIDVITISEANSMASAYNAAMKQSKAKYKIYLHQDTMILNKYYLENILKIFKSDDLIGLIGMVGNVHLDCEALFSFDKSHCVGNNINKYIDNYQSLEITDEDYIYDVEVVDGFIMATQYDLMWREDIFDAWDFYDLSQSMEFHRCGYRVIVPDQSGMEWCFHADDMTSTLYFYEKYRQIFKNEYEEDLLYYAIEDDVNELRTKSDEDIKHIIAEYNMLYKNASNFKKDINNIIFDICNVLKNQNITNIREHLAFFKDRVLPYAIFRISIDLIRIYHFLVASDREHEMGLTMTISDVQTIDDLRYKYIRTQMMLRRIEMRLPNELQIEAFNYLLQKAISPVFVFIILNNEYSSFSQTKRIFTEICHKYIEIGDSKRAEAAISLYKKDGK